MSIGVDGSLGHPDTEATGDLFLYSTLGYVAFEVGGHSAGSRALVCVGGLADGLLSLRYMPSLAEAVKGEGWRVIQPVLSSSYRGWGVGSLDEDVRELDTLLRFLVDCRGVQQVALLGCSTGCQDAVRYLQKGVESSRVVAAVLQAPVSDRETLMSARTEKMAAATKRYREQALAMIAERRGDEVLPRDAWKLLGHPDHPISAYRFDSLTGRLTDDDMFSSDLSKEELRDKLGHVSVPTLLVLGADDEYVPTFVDKQGLLQRISDAMGSGASGHNEVLLIKEGRHGLSSKAAELSAAVAGFLSRLPPSGAPAAVAAAVAAPKVTWEPGLADEIKARAAAHAAGAAAGRPLVEAKAVVAPKPMSDGNISSRKPEFKDHASARDMSYEAKVATVLKLLHSNPAAAGIVEAEAAAGKCATPQGLVFGPAVLKEGLRRWRGVQPIVAN